MGRMLAFALEDLDLASGAGGVGEADVCREERAIQGLGKGHVAGVVCSDVVADFPSATQQGRSGVDNERKVQ